RAVEHKQARLPDYSNVPRCRAKVRAAGARVHAEPELSKTDRWRSTDRSRTGSDAAPDKPKLALSRRGSWGVIGFLGAAAGRASPPGRRRAATAAAPSPRGLRGDAR